MSPMQYARSGLGTAELNGKLIAAGKRMSNSSLKQLPQFVRGAIDLWKFDTI